MTTRADQHDLDKLRRWRGDMKPAPGPDFPVHAVFLVSEKDRGAHDVFREFRRSFEERKAGFENLVIFGQHGVSEAVHAVSGALGLSGEPLPQLALLVSADEPRLYSVALPAGDVLEGEGDAGATGRTLARIEEWVDGGEAWLEPRSDDGLTVRTAPVESLAALVERLIGELG